MQHTRRCRLRLCHDKLVLCVMKSPAQVQHVDKFPDRGRNGDSGGL